MKTSKNIRIDGAKIDLFLFVSILSFFLFVSCERSSRKVYIVPYEDSISKADYTNKSGIVLMPPRPILAQFTFMVDSNNNFYYYELPEDTTQYGPAGDDRPPEVRSMGITANNIFRIPLGMERDFFRANVSTNSSSSHFKNVIIAYSKDTVVSDFIPFLRALKRDSSSKIGITFRRQLKEEREVLRYELKHR